MKWPHILLLIIMAFLIFSLAVPADRCPKLSFNGDEQSSCPLILKNTSSSIIWITTNQSLSDNITEQELEETGATFIEPYSSQYIAKGPWFSIYIRAPVTNDVFYRRYTFIQRSCPKAQDEFTITMDQIEQKTFNPKKLIVIDHESESPENSLLLCPDGKNPVFDTKQEQWFCQEELDEQKYFVPVYSYIYQWVPQFIISQWYIDHPTYYTWYHEHSEFWSHLKNYQPAWKTMWYRNWYKKALEAEKEYLRDPNEVEEESDEYQSESDEPFGLTADQVSIMKQL